jgi:hypothetical protein
VTASEHNREVFQGLEPAYRRSEVDSSVVYLPGGLDFVLCLSLQTCEGGFPMAVSRPLPGAVSEPSARSSLPELTAQPAQEESHPPHFVSVFTATATPAPAGASADTADYPDRQAALSTLEQIGLTTSTRSAAADPAVITTASPTLSPTPSPVSTTTASTTPAALVLESADTAGADGIFTLRRPADVAGWDMISLLALSSILLVILYVWMSRSMKSRTFSRYK